MRWYRFVAMVCLLVAGSEAANIRRIDFEGFDQVSVAGIRQKMPLKPGQPYDPAEAEKAADWLRSQGMFLEVTLDVKAQGQVTDLVFRVVENPLIRTVRIEGSTQISAAALRPSLLTQPRRVLNRRSLAIDASLIGTAFLENGLRCVVEVSLDPIPETPEPPVVVTFRITEAKIGRVRLEPLRYLKREALAPWILLEPGKLLREKELSAQRDRLMTTGLFAYIEEPATSEPDETGKVDVLYRVTEHEHPLINRELLPLIELDQLARTVRFQGVDVHVFHPDFYLYRTAAERQQALSDARAAAAARPDDPEAQYDLVVAAQRVGEPAEANAAAEQAVARLQPRASGGSPTLQLRLGQILAALDRDDAARQQLQRAAAAPETRVAAYEALLTLSLPKLIATDVKSRTELRELVAAGADAIAGMPAQVDLETLSSAYRFYHAGLTLSLTHLELRPLLRLDGPLSGKLVQALLALDATNPSAEVRRQLGRLLTATGFAAQAAGREVVSAEAWTRYQAALSEARNVLLTVGIETTEDPAAWFYVALNDLLREDLAGARKAALDGLRQQPLNERLVDIYILTCLQDRLIGGDVTRTQDLLRASIQDIQKQLASGQAKGWGALLLLAKLNLALRDTLPDEAIAAREQARQSAAAAAQNAVAANAEQFGGWWILGMARLKGGDAAGALEPFQKAQAIQPHYGEAAYAVALSLLAAGRTEEGLAAMQRLTAPPAG